MKALKKLSVTAMLILVMVQTTIAAISVPVSGSLHGSAEFNGQMVKAILNNGVYMPVVDLPVVEIIATKPGSMMVKGIIEKGEVLAVVELPTIEITVERPMNFLNNTDIGYSEIRDIPVIEIVDYFPETNLISGVVEGDQGIPLVDLPEVIISVDKKHKSHWLAFVNESLQEVSEVNVAHPEIKVILGQLESANELIADLSIELQKCLVVDKKTIVCEFVSETGYYASELIRNGIFKLIFKN